MAKYEPLATSCDLTVVTAEEALARLGLFRPVLRIHPQGLPAALRLNREGFGGLFNVEADTELEYWDEWYVEYNGRRVGSDGA